MNDQRQARSACGRDMGTKAPLLRLWRTVIVKIIQPGFAEGDDLRVFGQINQFFGGNAVFLIGGFGRGAARAIDVRKSLGDGKQSGEPLHPGRDCDDAADPGALGAPDNGVEIIGEIGKVAMAMPIDEHGFRTAHSVLGSTERGNTPTGGGKATAHLIRAPRDAKFRASWGMPRLSSSLLEASGITGCFRIATWRTTSAVTYSTVFCRAGSVLASAHGASPAK